MLRRTRGFFDAPQHDVLKLFPSFVAGSRRVTLSARAVGGDDAAASSNKAPQCAVHVVPMSHAATKAFFDKVSRFIELEQARHGDVRVVMEGVCDTAQQRDMESREWAAIAGHAAAEDAEPKSKAFMNQFRGLVLGNKLFRPETMADICASYQLPYPLPAELLLQDAYWRPCLAAECGGRLVNGDVILDALGAAAADDVARIRGLREASCAAAVRKLAAGGTRSIVVPWGHFHCAPIVELLTAHDDASAVAFEVTGGDERVVPYGWTDELLDTVYGVKPEPA
jgi:hypothetical protein